MDDNPRRHVAGEDNYARARLKVARILSIPDETSGVCEAILDYVNRYPDSRGLWIGSGPSAAQLLDKSASWYSRYAFVMLSNKAYIQFTEVARRSKPQWVYLSTERNNFRYDWFYLVPDCFAKFVHEHTFSPIKRYKQDGVRYTQKAEAARMMRIGLHNHGWQPREYIRGLAIEGSEHGLLGSVTLQAMHLACIMGASHLDMIGCEFAGGHFYALSEKVKASFFIHSAPIVDAAYTDKFLPAGMECSLFCPSLITAIPQVEVSDG